MGFHCDLPDKIGRALASVSTSMPYPYFSVDQILDENQYELLRSEFPDDLIQHDSENSGALELYPDTPIDTRLSQEWQTFVGYLRSDETRKRLVSICYHHTLRRYPRWMRPLAQFRLSNSNNYQIRLAFNSSTGGRYLRPHSDNSYKVLALILYFSDTSHESLELGTRFFSPKSRRAEREAVRRFNRLADSRLIRTLPLQLLPMTSCNVHNNTSDEASQRVAEKWFSDNFDLEHIVGFKGNRVAGFIKTQNSFHAVDLRSAPADEVRRSLLINLNLKHSLIARLGQMFRVRVLRKAT